MYYEINVSKDGYHFFATHKRSLVTQRDLFRVYMVFKKAFTAEAGYKISVKRWDETGLFLDMDEWLNEYKKGREVA